MSRDWSDAEDETLRTLWADGASAGQIMRQLTGRSRSAVLGRVHRLKLAQRAASLSQVKPHRLRSNGPKQEPKPPKPPVAPTEDPGPMDPSIDTMALRDHHCKWPYDAPDGGYHYCGQKPEVGHPWCLHHCTKAYQPPQSKKSAA